MYRYVDVHAHLSHALFQSDLDTVIDQCIEKNVEVIANGTDRSSNRFNLNLASRYPNVVKASLGIYPVEALVNLGIIDQAPYEVDRFDVKEEIEFIKGQSVSSKIVAIGEIGMDAHSLDKSTFDNQEKIFCELIQIGIDSDLPLIVHSRKIEERVLSVLANQHAQRVVLHCFCAGATLAEKYAEKYGWMFSLPVTTPNNSRLQALCKRLDLSNLLTETDSPYLNLDRGVRNHPANVISTVDYIATVKKLDTQSVLEALSQNYHRMFES